MGLHVIWRLRMFFLQPKVFGSESDRTALRMRVDRIAMSENGGILFRGFLRLLYRCGLYDEDAADRSRLVVKRPGRHLLLKESCAPDRDG